MPRYFDAVVRIPKDTLTIIRITGHRLYLCNTNNNSHRDMNESNVRREYSNKLPDSVDICVHAI